MSAALESPSLTCLTDEEVVEFALGRLTPARLAEAHVHLDECDVCQCLLSESARSLASATTLPSLDWQAGAWNTTFRAGSVVGGRYQIRRFIARGGMGEVYEAFDRELGERVALKTVTSTACDNPKAVRRLKAEVQLARRVSHPHVCRMFDFGTHLLEDSGASISFLTMEFVEGETLGARLRSRGALPIADARRIGRELLLGLGAAHDAGVMHRDFKSDNVMLKEVNGVVHPLISDFGLARAFDTERRDGSVSNANLVGTISYLAPEQLEGKPHTFRSDIYALGMVWFEMLTGELPFEDSPTAAVAALGRMQRPVPAASTRNPLVPFDLDAVVAGCLQRLPKHRFKTTGQALATLDELERRARPLLRRWQPWLIGFAALLVTLLAVGLLQRSAPPVVVAPPPPPLRVTPESPRAVVEAQAPPAAVPEPTRSPKRVEPAPQRRKVAKPRPKTAPDWENPFENDASEATGRIELSDSSSVLSQNSGETKIK